MLSCRSSLLSHAYSASRLSLPPLSFFLLFSIDFFFCFGFLFGLDITVPKRKLPKVSSFFLLKLMMVHILRGHFNPRGPRWRDNFWTVGKTSEVYPRSLSPANRSGPLSAKCLQMISAFSAFSARLWRRGDERAALITGRRIELYSARRVTRFRYNVRAYY